SYLYKDVLEFEQLRKASKLVDILRAIALQLGSEVSLPELGGLVGLDITEQLHIGYSYDWSFGLKTSKYNQGSHEILLRYDFVFSSKKQIHSPRYF
ncbi:MAG: type IX secretion system membrane protein PorP/SprF, partial [Bacteroidetes bacterium]|nr:type IX secretion system membrane protein PorP/SprF [Bacteroidota bacterium]